MAVQDVMTNDYEYIPKETTVLEAARKMKDMDTGFLPIADKEKDKLCGVITDRDITIRAVAAGKDPQGTKVEEVLSDQVLYCYANDPIESAANSMRDQNVYRLVVLDNDKDKRICGILSLGDIVRAGQVGMAQDAAEGIQEGEQQQTAH